MQRCIHLSLLVANVLVAVAVITLTAVRVPSSREAEPVQEWPAAAQAGRVESGAAKSRGGRSPTLGEDGDVLDVLRQAFEGALATIPPPRTQVSEESVFTLSRWKPVAHLTGVSMDLHNESDSALEEVRGWLWAGEGRIVRNGFQVRGGRLIVPAQGWYRFYAFIKFQTRGFKNDSANFEVQLYRMDGASFTEQQLSSQSHVLGQGPAVTAIRGLREYGLYIQALHQFKALDELYIKVNHLSALEGNKEWHYMGAHLV